MVAHVITRSPARNAAVSASDMAICGRLAIQSARLGDAGRTADAGSADPAVAPGILGEVLLVVVLGVVERRGIADLGRDLAVAGLGQRLLKRRARAPGGLLLRVPVTVDRGSILRADIVSLAHALGRVVVLPEDPEKILVADLRGIEGDEHH